MTLCDDRGLMTESYGQGYLSVRLRSIKKEIADKETAVAEKEGRRLETEKQSLYQTRRLGKHPYPYQCTHQEGLCLKELLGVPKCYEIWIPSYNIQSLIFIAVTFVVDLVHHLTTPEVHPLFV